MEIHAPMIITSRLLPGIKINDCTISIKITGNDSDGRTTYYVYFDGDNNKFNYIETELKSGCQGGTEKEGLTSILSFLSAAGEAYAYNLHRTTNKSENSDLFPPFLNEWAYQNSDEITLAQLELEEGIQK